MHMTSAKINTPPILTLTKATILFELPYVSLLASDDFYNITKEYLQNHLFIGYDSLIKMLKQAQIPCLSSLLLKQGSSDLILI